MAQENTPDHALRELFRLSPDAVCGICGGRVVFANPAAAELFGRDVTGEPAVSLFPGVELEAPDDAVAAAAVAGQERRLTAVRYESVTVLTVLREERTVSIPPAALSRIRTAASNLRFSLDRLTDPEADDPYTAVLYHSYYSLLHVTNQLSDVNALAAGDMVCRLAPLELGQLVGDLTDSTAFFVRDRSISLTCRVPAEPCFVMADRERMEQLLLILLSNSLAHTPAGGRIQVSLRRADRQYILTVEDTGSGMSNSDLASAFSLRTDLDPASAGTRAGMGLYIAQGIARLHGGALVLRSREEQGTRVSLSLPARNTLTLRDAEAPGPTGPQRILTELADLLPAEAYRPRYLD